MNLYKILLLSLALLLHWECVVAVGPPKRALRINAFTLQRMSETGRVSLGDWRERFEERKRGLGDQFGGWNQPTEFQGHTDRVNSVAMSADGKRVVSGGYDRKVRVWDIDTGELSVFQGHTDRVNSVAMSADGKRVVAGGYDRKVRVWDIATGKSTVLEGHTDLVRIVAMSADGKRVVSGGDDSSARVWDAATGKSTVLEGHRSTVNSVAMSVDGRWVASGCSYGKVCVWDADTGKSTVLKGHTNTVNSVAMSVDGRRVVSGGYDGKVRVWDARYIGIDRTLSYEDLGEAECKMLAYKKEQEKSAERQELGQLAQEQAIE